MRYPRDLRISEWLHGPHRKVLLLGDAAYSMAPYPLHETALPVEDAAVLATALAAPSMIFSLSCPSLFIALKSSLFFLFA